MSTSRTSRAFGAKPVNAKSINAKSMNLSKMALPPDLSAGDIARMKAKHGQPHVQPAPWLRSILERIADRLLKPRPKG
jgi:hypothetical protein